MSILRALAQRPAGATGRELAHAADVAHQATLDSLTRLEAAGIVSRLPMGRGYLFRLNREHLLVQGGLLPFLEQEAEFGRRLRAKLRSAFERYVVTGLIFGSAGRGEERPESDLDVCLILKRSEDKDRVLERAGRMADEFWREFGVRLSPLVLTAAEASRGLRSHKHLLANIREDGERFVGKPWEVLDRG